MKITFINVGQGDSIILSWYENDKEVIAIIDSNNEGYQQNPTVEFLKTIHFDQVKFILLSHPHYDHYSGLLDILEYISGLNITIDDFLFTSFQSIDFLISSYKDSAKTITAVNALQNLFNKVNDLDRKNQILNIVYCHDRIRDIKLEDKIYLRLLCPSNDEFQKYLNLQNIFNEEGPHNNPKANYLSSVIQIFDEDNTWQVILTSDQEAGSFNKILSKYKSAIDKLLILAQTPHHGSYKNLNQLFWGSGMPSKKWTKN